MISPDKQYEADTNLYNPSEIEKKMAVNMDRKQFIQNRRIN